MNANPANVTRIFLGLALVLASCVGPNKYSMTAADEAAPIVARYACAKPTAFALQGTGVYEPDHTSLELRRDERGLFLVSGATRTVVNNHWSAPDGDHFFLLTANQTFGGETVISPDGTFAYDALHVSRFSETIGSRDADGVDRPVGVPNDIASCRRTDLVPPTGEVVKRVNAELATPAAPRTKFTRVACSLKGSPSATDEPRQNVHYDWMPLYVYQDAMRRYVSFATIAELSFAVQPATSFTFGVTTFRFREAQNPDQITVVGEICGRPNAMIACTYQHDMR